MKSDKHDQEAKRLHHRNTLQRTRLKAAPPNTTESFCDVSVLISLVSYFYFTPAQPVCSTHHVQRQLILFCSNLTDTPNPKNKMRPCKHSCPWNAARVSWPLAGPRRWAFSLCAAGLPHVCDFLFIRVFSKCAWPSEPPYRSDSLQSIIPVSRLQAGVFALNVSLRFIFWQQESLCSVSVPSGRWMRLNVFFICPPDTLGMMGGDTAWRVGSIKLPIELQHLLWQTRGKSWKLFNFSATLGGYEALRGLHLLHFLHVRGGSL